MSSWNIFQFFFQIKPQPEYDIRNPDNVADPSEVKMSSTGPLPSNILSNRTSFRFCPQTVCSLFSNVNRITNLSKLHSTFQKRGDIYTGCS